MDTAKTTPPGGHAAVYDALMWPLERAAVGEWRRRLVAHARGRVLEVGAGTGSQLRWYAAATEVVALEPDPGMAARARRRAARASASVTVMEGVAEALPFAASTFDSAVSAFAFCSVADPARAFAELRRVLVPGGRLEMLEHVHLPWQPGRRLQSIAAPAWAAAAGGCRLDRDTGRFMSEAGFSILQARSHMLGWVVEFSARSPSGLHATRASA